MEEYSQHKLIKNIFELDENEQILYKFSCVLSGVANIPGHLYVTRNFLCFNAHLLGFDKKVSQVFTYLS